ncbi:uncharacterized protein LY89DRAFT_680236 [Mollisia scopiformis]|uniref:2EXR domain-containing protein n=1 Tax=Mollisia scopiformis TaxID=149040 RepID=A0A194XUV7_MOLSC|nr:uncharacterized protein LY89DRAFT_680236 [Mollisia scopiformis]KUJ23492.1 hypothetical protein LY89DRAFT_680236 [Mollisia scopiformis]
MTTSKETSVQELPTDAEPSKSETSTSLKTSAQDLLTNMESSNLRDEDSGNIPSTDVQEVCASDDPLFEYFPDLPLELRQKIWKHAIPLFPRIVMFDLSDSNRNRAMIYTPSTQDKWVVSVSSPATLLNVCHEAREEILQYYDTPLVDHGTTLRPSCILINLEIDLLFFTSLDTFVKANYREGLYDCIQQIFGPTYGNKIREELRHLAIDHKLALKICDPISLNPPSHAGFNLEYMEIVFDLSYRKMPRRKVYRGDGLWRNPLWNDFDEDRQAQLMKWGAVDFTEGRGAVLVKDDTDSEVSSSISPSGNLILRASKPVYVL